MSPSDYEQAGVRGQGDALSAVARFLGPTLDDSLLTTFGHYASVIQLDDDNAMAISTDGVGSKTLIASALGRYDTIGFDCVAMNVNDVVCVGAKPRVMVDYLGVHTLDEARTSEILQGLGSAAKEAEVMVPGGELAQLPEVIGSDGKNPGDDTAFDLVGTCVGFLHPKRLILGQDVQVGDVLLGLHSSGVHSNGLTLARHALLRDGGLTLDQHVAELGCTVGEELLKPTRIYSPAIASMWDEGIETRGLVHVTGDGFGNLGRLNATVGYRIDKLPEAPPIFELIRTVGRVDDAEMFRVFNMGIGFVAIVPPTEEERAARFLVDRGHPVTRIGTVVAEPGITIEPIGLVGEMSDGDSVFRRA